MTPGSEWKRTVEVKAGVPEKRTTNESKKKKKKSSRIASIWQSLWITLDNNKPVTHCWGIIDVFREYEFGGRSKAVWNRRALIWCSLFHIWTNISTAIKPQTSVPSQWWLWWVFVLTWKHFLSLQTHRALVQVSQAGKCFGKMSKWGDTHDYKWWWCSAGSPSPIWS